MKYELKPTDGRKSFYGIAFVEVTETSETLYSYGTPILEKDRKTGIYKKLWSGWSATTGRHIKAYSGMNKAAYEKL